MINLSSRRGSSYMKLSLKIATVALANNSGKSAALYKEAVTKVTKEIATKSSNIVMNNIE